MDYSQLTDQQLNKLSAVKFMQGDASEAWLEGFMTNWQPCTDLNQAVMVAERLGRDIYVERFVGQDYWVMIGELNNQSSVSENSRLSRAIIEACLMAMEGEG